MDLVEASRPPDPELVDLIEQAFLEGQIDGKTGEILRKCEESLSTHTGHWVWMGRKVEY